ncbi:DExH-box ATP-dependent RNA helicase DExH15 chloroplastic [Rhododendron vialii]|uniref:DExH-box ATP-dependent RNA helicase DExH15 chloroplastic n=1 Tax=Rhododendron vialii TaxID=182163 RepID=UPI002660036C|nr:DExH-box ATP-dependent RNA helicase DExH15 chloroplastic [Rhododendron vialii]XP_058192939.1 DExH-box ATP-dependent RNA helicase DExH15 chloroplastic [Rhododendron vialii]XP_058192940.1 DExH-box ATP-dependent RNA helicase DExH15 chloroplastic [Rhododendron vialii]XP_058192941.1 DExH-box ATP-dependent RNA helicase DExH15 chloroplastic [Rhododendron vialii]XP_058192942.1 DExH-box ATP-dependent RNA helicase DExH15 chloroplastic [Rhododendron vialii]XP_058192943.1 DExH-box ATP-dependent RNA hel
MNALSTLSPPHISAFHPSKTSPFLHPAKTPTPTLVEPLLGFCSLKPLRTSTPNHSPHFPASYKFPRSLFPSEPQISDDFEDDDDDDEEAADEYDDVPGEVLDGGELSEEDEVESPVDDDDDDGALEGKPVFEEFKWQRVERVLNEVREFGEEIIDVDELASIYNFRIDKFQRLAIQAFLRGSSVVVSAPTSSGKTLIAEAAAVATVARGKRLFYTTPLKALSNQKFRDFRETFGVANVGLLTGDSAINKDAQVIIMTTEILRNMMYRSVGRVSSESGLCHGDVVVLDEVHYLSDMYRGTVWEEIVIYCPKDVQLICLSATVANPDELAGWIGQIHGKTELVTSSKRPVPLIWLFSTKGSLLPLLDEKGTSMNRKLSLNYLQHYSSGVTPDKDEGSRRRSSRKRESNMSYSTRTHMYGQSLSKNDMTSIRRSQVPQVLDTLGHLRSRDMLPAVWFIFSRKGCDAAVQYLEDCNLLDECEMSEVELALKRFRIQYPDAVKEASVKGLLRGVAAHHAGCLPLWKSFIEELFQGGLLKVVFATETLAAGINMPARTAVISSLSKRSESGRIQVRSNDLLQMAGRAGRRGIDERGHVVLVQTPNEGAEECCKLLFSALEPLVSQFTASYGMVLNLLAGGKVTRGSNDADGMKVSQPGRTLEEARKLVEQTFGNYVGSNVMLAAKEELSKIQNEIERLSLEISDEAIDRKSQKLLPERAYKEIADFQKELRDEKRVRSELRRRMEKERISTLRHLLEEFTDGQLPFMTLQYSDAEGVQHLVSAVYLGKVDSPDGSKLKDMVYANDSFALNVVGPEFYCADTEKRQKIELSYHVALGSDNSWYLFTEKWVKMLYKTGFPNVALAHGDPLPRETMRMLLDKEEMQWQKLVNSELGDLWCMDGSLDTWSWSLNVPVVNSLSEDDEVQQFSQEYHSVLECYKDQRNKVARLKKKISRTEGFKEYKKIVDMAKYSREKIRRLEARSKRLISRIEQIEPSGWKEFVKVSNVIHEARAMDINTRMLFPLGETAAAIRGENELWLAMVLRNKILLDLKPAQLAAVCGSLVSEGIKVRPSKNNSYMYEPSNTVIQVINFLDEQRSFLLHLQEKHNATKSCCLDSQFSGIVEAWASGLTWREIMMDCAMDEGDLSRLLRRTMDLLAQIPKLPDIDPLLKSNAVTTSNIMDRPPISELAG